MADLMIHRSGGYRLGRAQTTVDSFTDTSTTTVVEGNETHTASSVTSVTLNRHVTSNV